MKNFNKRTLNAIYKQCGIPEDFVFDNVCGRTNITGLKNILTYTEKAKKIINIYKKKHEKR
jgi:hypothetical protein